MEALRESINKYVTADVQKVLNNYFNEYSARLSEKIVANSVLTEKDVIGMLQEVLSKFQPDKPAVGAAEKEMCSVCKKAALAKRKDVKALKMCGKCHKKSLQPKPLNVGDNGVILKCITMKRTKDGKQEECGKNCCAKSHQFCASHLAAKLKQDTKAAAKPKASEKGKKKGRASSESEKKAAGSKK
jgi:hypothetical protein